tara:strand:+ start:3672 stop:3935 length:264 start_codon:yes stop_codon:yes gene_type:complete
MTEEKNLRDAVVALFDYCPAEEITNHLNKGTASLVSANAFEDSISKADAVFTQAKLINFIHRLNYIVNHEKDFMSAIGLMGREGRDD